MFDAETRMRGAGSDLDPFVSDDETKTDRQARHVDARHVGAGRVCDWCGGCLSGRRDAIFCSKRCRQASWRFGAGRPRGVSFGAGETRRFAYADPPYLGKSNLYRGHVDYAGEVDHGELFSRLSSYDGWALSASAASLRELLTLSPAGTKVAAWVRGERPTVSYGPLSSWEPVMYWGARPRLTSSIEARRLDSLVYVSRPRLTDTNRVIGAKPGAFCWWLFQLLGAIPGDSLDDLFPGSGGVARAWRDFSRLPTISDG